MAYMMSEGPSCLEEQFDFPFLYSYIIYVCMLFYQTSFKLKIQEKIRYILGT